MARFQICVIINVKGAEIPDASKVVGAWLSRAAWAA